MRTSLLLRLVLCALAAPARADVYFGESANGVPAFSDRPESGFRLYLSTEDLPAGSPARLQPAAAFREGMRRHARQIEAAAAEQGIDPALLHAVVQVESGYNAQAVSLKGATGLMQLMPATARSLGVRDSLDPVANLRGGARHLRRLTESLGDLSLALAAYNAGEAAVRRHELRIPPFAETLAYVPAVLRRYELLKGRL
jgi:soluble lytic murein transglycosylase-like protein